MPVDLRHRTTEIEVDARWRQARKLRRIVRQIVGIAAEQLHIDRHAGRRPPAVIQFRADAPETAQRHLRPGNADELAHRRIIAAHLRQHIAQQPVGQAFHRRKNNAGGHGAQKRKKNSGIGTGLDTRLDTKNRHGANKRGKNGNGFYPPTPAPCAFPRHNPRISRAALCDPCKRVSQRGCPKSFIHADFRAGALRCPIHAGFRAGALRCPVYAGFRASSKMSVDKGFQRVGRVRCSGLCFLMP